MKRFFCLLLCLLFLLPAFTACQSASDKKEEGEGSQSTDTTTETKKVVGNPSAFGNESDPDSVLPTLYLTTGDGEEIDTKDYRATTVSVRDAADEQFNVTDLSAQVRCRGNYTYTSTEKKSYHLKFDEKINLLGQDTGKARSWVLLAEHCDQSFLRNHIAFAMATVLDRISYVSSSSFVVLYVNGEYQGVYHLIEAHQVQANRVAIEEDPDTVDTNYLIELDYYASGKRNVDYFTVDNVKYGIKSDYNTRARCTFLTEFFEKAWEAVQSGEQSEIEQYLDIGSFVDMYLLQEIAKNIDVGWSSFFLIKQAGGTIACTWPWDFDLAFGNDERLDSGSYEGLYVGNSSYSWWFDQSNQWFTELMSNKWFVDLVSERLNEVGETMENLAISEIDRITECFSDQMEANFELWPIFGQKINQEPEAIRNLSSYSEHTAYLRNWVIHRFEWLTDYFNGDSKYETTENPWNNWWNWEN
jgi:spore coat protein CotH